MSFSQFGEIGESLNQFTISNSFLFHINIRSNVFHFPSSSFSESPVWFPFSDQIVFQFVSVEQSWTTACWWLPILNSCSQRHGSRSKTVQEQPLFFGLHIYMAHNIRTTNPHHHQAHHHPPAYGVQRSTPPPWSGQRRRKEWRENSR